MEAVLNAIDDHADEASITLRLGYKPRVMAKTSPSCSGVPLKPVAVVEVESRWCWAATRVPVSW